MNATLPALTSWLTETAWPLWRDHGVDRARGGFHEALSPETLACPADFRRLRVVTRQVYVFSQAAAHGLPGATELVEMGIDFLSRKAKQPDNGYAWRFSLDGEVIDNRRDLYDHAFVLLALSSAARVLPAEPLKAEALALIAWLDRHMPHPDGGYVEALPITDEPRRQNPHMHLLEACLTAWEIFAEPVFLLRASSLVTLFLNRLFQPESGTLPEFFTDELTPVSIPGGHHVEPGHHMEWIWLLDWFGRCLTSIGRPHPVRLGPATWALQRFVDRFGISPTHGALMDELAADGRIIAAGARLWPQTERLKAEAIRRPTVPHGLPQALTMLAPYFDHPTPGLWHERRGADGAFLPGPVPASSLYHLTCALLFAGSPLPPGAKKA